MSTLFSVTNCEPMQAGFQFPQSLTEKYRPMTFADFAGINGCPHCWEAGLRSSVRERPLTA